MDIKMKFRFPGRKMNEQRSVKYTFVKHFTQEKNISELFTYYVFVTGRKFRSFPLMLFLDFEKLITNIQQLRIRTKKCSFIDEQREIVEQIN